MLFSCRIDSGQSPDLLKAGHKRGRRLQLGVLHGYAVRMDHGHSEPPTSSSSLNIALASDYFFPKFGGVESHIYSLAQALAKREHRVRAPKPRSCACA